MNRPFSGHGSYLDFLDLDLVFDFALAFAIAYGMLHRY